MKIKPLYVLIGSIASVFLLFATIYFITTPPRKYMMPKFISKTLQEAKNILGKENLTVRVWFSCNVCNTAYLCFYFTSNRSMMSNINDFTKQIHSDGSVTYSIHYKAGLAPDFLSEEEQIAELLNLAGLEMTRSALESYDTRGESLEISGKKLTVQGLQKKSIIRPMDG